MTRDEVDTFDKLSAQLDSLHQELSVLVKKAPNDAVNAFKIKFVNATLTLCNAFFGDKYKPFASFEQFSVDDLPSNSDVTFIVSQYIECAEKFRTDNIRMEAGWWFWQITGKGDPIRTASPKVLRKRD